MEPLYKVGDTVLVKSEYDEECDEFSYRYIFVDDMLEECGGEIYTIRWATFNGKNLNEDQIPDDGYLYCLEGNTWSWASSMFEPEF